MQRHTYAYAHPLTHTRTHARAQISHDSAMGLVQRALDEGYNVTELIVDTVGDAGRYTEMLSARFPGIRCVAKAKADAIYPIVSAASVAAKVTRDRGMRGWEFDEAGADAPPDEGGFSRDFGSGYPSDPATVRCARAILCVCVCVRLGVGWGRAWESISARAHSRGH